MTELRRGGEGGGGSYGVSFHVYGCGCSRGIGAEPLYLGAEPSGFQVRLCPGYGFHLMDREFQGLLKLFWVFPGH